MIKWGRKKNRLRRSEEGGEAREIGGCLGSQADKAFFLKEESDRSSNEDRASKMSAGKWPSDLATWKSRLLLRRRLKAFWE